METPGAAVNGCGAGPEVETPALCSEWNVLEAWLGVWPQYCGWMKLGQRAGDGEEVEHSEEWYSTEAGHGEEDGHSGGGEADHSMEAEHSTEVGEEHSMEGGEHSMEEGDTDTLEAGAGRVGQVGHPLQEQ